ncbi:hypothetical protein GCM10010349_18550 [Streptomyces flavofungini]|nr:hypothetical protein GCM10010349_18550 [Streptomyces flavofungini]
MPEAGDRRFTDALAAGDYPSLRRLAPHFRDTSFDGRFEHGLDLLLGTRADQGLPDGAGAARP